MATRTRQLLETELDQLDKLKKEFEEAVAIAQHPSASSGYNALVAQNRVRSTEFRYRECVEKIIHLRQVRRMERSR